MSGTQKKITTVVTRSDILRL